MQNLENEINCRLSNILNRNTRHPEDNISGILSQTNTKKLNLQYVDNEILTGGNCNKKYYDRDI